MNPLSYILQGIGIICIGLAVMSFILVSWIQRKLAPQHQPGLSAAQRKAASWLTAEIPEREQRTIRRLKAVGFLLGFAGLVSWTLTLFRT